MLDSRLLQLEAQALLVGRLKQPWTEMTMNLNRQTDHALTQITVVRQAHYLSRASVFSVPPWFESWSQPAACALCSQTPRYSCSLSRCCGSSALRIMSSTRPCSTT